jgi:hypothetical protein
MLLQLGAQLLDAFHIAMVVERRGGQNLRPSIAIRYGRTTDSLYLRSRTYVED